jgi:hypothetical protein
MKIQISDGERSETHDVKNVIHEVQEREGHDSRDVGDEYWVVEDIQPSATDIIPSHLTWLSGSMADPRDADERSKFPLVYIPKNSDITVTEDEQ